MKTPLRERTGRVDLPLLALGLFAFACTASGLAAKVLTTMPPLPTDPKDYVDKWDPFVIPALGDVGDAFPLANGRQIARDASGGWLVLVAKERGRIFLAWGGSRAAGGDLVAFPLIGGPGALFAAQGEPTGAGMVVDASDRLHVIWNDERGLWYATAPLGGSGPGRLRDLQTWLTPRRLVNTRCHHGDIMLDAAGKPAVCYSQNDTVYYLPVASAKAEPAAGIGAGMPALAGLSAERKVAVSDYDDANPRENKEGSYRGPRPFNERECQESVMDLCPDGGIYLAFRRDFEIWVAQRTPRGTWLPAECAALGLAFHPSLLACAGRPLVCFQFEGIKKVTLGGADYLRQREGGGSSVVFAARDDTGWHSDYLAKSEEIIVNRQGIWDKRYEGKVLPMVEEMGHPVLFRDRHGVPWALWQDATRRWAYSARWMGDGFGQVQECRGPFNDPGFSVNAEKLMPPQADDVGVAFLAANRVIFDRLKIPTLSTRSDREILFLDSLEIGATSGVDFVLNRMRKYPGNPVLSPGRPGSRDDRHVQVSSVRKHGSTYVMTYSYYGWNDGEGDSDVRNGALAISADGIHWRKVARLPPNLPAAEPDPDATNPVARGYFDNPDTSDPEKRFMRTVHFGQSGWGQGSYRVQYSPDGKRWTDGPETSVFNAIREGGRPNLWDPLDIPERRIKAYGRVYTTNARSCGVLWSSDLINWSGAENFLDPDNPYGVPPAGTVVGPMRAQVFLDACAGKGEDQIYDAHVRIVDGLYFCDYLPCTFDHRFDVAIAVSRDGLNFTRVKNGESTLPVGPPGSWDSGIAYSLTRLRREGDVLRGYYTGTTWHHGTEQHSYPALQVGMATIRVNGWTYYTPKPDAGDATVTTIPIHAASGARRGLAVNVDGPPSAFAVEVLDAATDQPVDGFAAADCLTLASTGVAVGVEWKGGRMLPAGREIRLRFRLHGAGIRLYSFGFRPIE